MINRYSLADYTMAVDIPGRDTLTFGGPGENQLGSFIGQIAVSRNAEMWTTEGDVTGSWVHNKSLNKTGTISMQIRQISDDVIRLFDIARTYENSDSSEIGATITISRGTDTVLVGNDCYLTKMPDQVFGDAAEMQTWVWTCGQIKMIAR